MSEARILATGPELLGQGVCGIAPEVEDMIASSKTEIQILAYVISASANAFLNLLEDALRRHVRLLIVINKINDQDRTVVRKLKSMDKKYAGLRVVGLKLPNGGDLHAKVIVSDRKKAIVGSANFSWHGMSHNYEIGVLLEGSSAWKLGKMVDELVEGTAVSASGSSGLIELDSMN